MTATLPFIQKTFDRFNALCFDRVLPAVPLSGHLKESVPLKCDGHTIEPI